MGAVAETRDLPLLPWATGTLPVGADPKGALRVIEEDLALWTELERRAAFHPRFSGEGKRLSDIGRDLRALRDCYRAARHPKVREALLGEAARVTRRMKALGARFGVRGLQAID